MSLLPCYLEDDREILGYVENHSGIHGWVIRLPVGQVEALDSFEFYSIGVPRIKLQIDLRVRRRQFSQSNIERLHYRPHDEIGFLEKLQGYGCPIGISDVDIDTDESTNTTRYAWNAVHLDLETYEELFDLPQFIVANDTSNLIDHERLSRFCANVGVSIKSFAR